MWNRARTLLAATDGAITNFREIAAELSGAGYSFATRSDTEVLLAAFEHWGIDAIGRLRGGFAFALRNEEAQECVLARDRLGIKPLYYTEVDGALAFASESTALLAAPGVRRELDLESLGDYLAYGYLPAGRSIWRGIHKLPPGHVLRFRPGTRATGFIDLHRYWQPPAAPGPGDCADRGRAASHDELRESIAEAVRLAMIADVPVGVLLSAEIDASLLVALMGKTGDPVHSFTVDFEARNGTESPRAAYARSVAKRYAAEHHERRLPLDCSLAALSRVVASYDEPVADASIVPSHVLAEDVASELKLALSSEGGSMVFGGDDGAPIARSGRDLVPLFREKGFFDAPSRRALLDPGLAGEMDDDVLRHWRPHWLPQLSSSGKVRLLELSTELPDRTLPRLDRASMHHALEIRLPLLDHRVIEQAVGLHLAPASTHTDGSSLRRALTRELLPSPPATRAFPWSWLCTRRPSWLARRGARSPVPGDPGPDAHGKARLLSGELMRHGLVRRPAIAALLAQRSARGRRQAFLLLVLDLWLETHLS
jgi:asparagine synthase (glutamine-hydrolysing)